jgi:uncharacterized membrane protein
MLDLAAQHQPHPAKVAFGRAEIAGFAERGGGESGLRSDSLRTMGQSVQFARLALAALAWFWLHAGIAGSPLRGWLVGRFGEKAYRGGFSLASLGTLWWLVHEYRSAPYVALWSVPAPLYYVPVVLVPLALMLAVGAFTVPNPSSLGGEKLLAAAEPARGMLRVTRHPFLWSVVVWSLAHLLVNADASSLLFFTGLGLTALRGTFDIDRKRRRSNPEEFARFAAVTSNLPFAAVLAGRNRLLIREVWLTLLLGFALAFVAVALHAQFFGAPALPRFYG